MSLTSCLFVAGTLPRELLSIDLIHLIDDIFWNLTFNNKTQAEKVIVIMHIIYLISIIPIILIISIILQVRIKLRIPDHVWQEKRSVIAATIDGLGHHWVLSSSLNCVRHGWRTSARPIRMGRLQKLTAWERACWRLMIESLMLLVCILTYNSDIIVKKCV
jgi:hypothetical protein